MSVAESFLKTARDLLMMSENMKRVDARLDQVTDDLASLDRRLMRIELKIELGKDSPRRRSPKELL